MPFDLISSAGQAPAGVSPSVNSPQIVALPTAPQPSVMQANPAVYQPTSFVYDIFAVPPTMTFTAASNNGASAVTTTIYIFNNSSVGGMNLAVTNNGSGAGSITNTYGDGFSGKMYDRGVSSWNAGRGIGIKGFLLQSTTTSTGAQYATAFNTLLFQINNANFQGTTIPNSIDVSSGINNQMYLSGTLSIRQAWYLNSANQISCALPVNTTFAYTFYTETSTF